MKSPMTSDSIEIAKEYRRVRRYSFSPRVFLNTFEQGQKFEVLEGMPRGAELRGFAHDWERNCIVLFIEHESFDLVYEGNIPEDSFVTMKVIN